MYKSAFLWSVALALWAQTAGLEVTVKDPSDKVIAGARIELLDAAGTVVKSASTGRRGMALLESPAGEYTVRIAADGFAPAERRGVTLTAETVSIAIELRIEQLAAAVQVVGEMEARAGRETAGRRQLQSSRPTDLVEKLNELGGVQGIRRGATNLDPVIQGLREYQLAMVVDDTRTFAAGPGRMDSELSHVASGTVGEVEVVKGPYALTNGAGAMAAILVRSEAIPYYNDWGFGGELAAGYSFNDTDRFARATVFGANRRFGFKLNGVGDKSNNYEAGKSGDTPVWVPARHSHHQFGGKFRFNVRENQELLFGGGYDEQTNVDYPGRQLDANHFITRMWNGAYHVKKPSARLAAMKFGLYLNKKSHRMNNDHKPTAQDMAGRMPPFGLAISLPTESDTGGGFGRFDFAPAPSWTIAAGFDFYGVDQDAQRFISRRSNGALLVTDRPWPDVKLNDQGAYVQTSKSFESGEVSAALRLDFVQADAREPSAFFLENTTGSVAQSEVNTSFSISGRRKVTEGLTVSGGFGRVVRSLNGLERYSDRFPSTRFQIAAEFLGAPGGKPEVSYQGDVAVEYTYENLTLVAGLFYRRLDDYLTVYADPDLPKKLPMSFPVVYRYMTGDHANYRGFDFGARWQFARGFELRTQGAKTLADDVEEDAPAVGQNEPLLGVPPFEIRSGLRYTYRQRVWGDFAVRNVWSQRRAAASRLEMPSPGFTTFDVRFGADLPRRFGLLVAFENLTDKYYFEHINSLNPFTRERVLERGRNFHVSFSKQF